MKTRIFLLALFVMAIGSMTLWTDQCHAVAKVGEDTIGEITRVTGQVMVRTKGKWEEVTQAPHPLFNNDKVVTKQGRAELKFADGTVLKMDVDSNMSIVQKEEKGGVFKKASMTREVNVLVGNVWFDVKLEKGGEMKFRTPTMVAAIRGTTGGLGSNVDGSSTGGLTSGAWQTLGTFTPIVPRTIDTNVAASNLPASNPAVWNTPAMQAVANAVTQQNQANNAQANVNASAQTSEDPNVVLLAAAAQSEAALQGAQAAQAAAQEALNEAVRLGNNEAAAAAQQSLNLANAQVNSIQQNQQQISNLANQLANATSPQQAAAIADLAQVNAQAATASYASAFTAAQMTIAQVTGDANALAAAQAAYNANQQTQQQLNNLSTQGQNLINQLADADSPQEANALAAAADALTSAATALSTEAQLQAVVSSNVVAGDNSSLLAAQNNLNQSQTLSDDAMDTLNNILNNIEQGRYGQVQGDSSQLTQTSDDAQNLLVPSGGGPGSSGGIVGGNPGGGGGGGGGVSPFMP